MSNRLQESLDRIENRYRRTLSAEEREPLIAALQVVREEIRIGEDESTGELSARLWWLLSRWLPAQGEQTRPMTELLTRVAMDLAEELYERGEPGIDRLLEQRHEMEADLLRAADAAELLAAQCAVDDEDLIAGAVSAGDVTLSSGLSSLIDLPGLRLEEAIHDEWVVQSLDREAEGISLALQSEPQRLLGEPAIVLAGLPERLADRLRPGDKIDAEVAPSGAGWRLLAMFAVIPRGYHELDAYFSASHAGRD